MLDRAAIHHAARNLGLAHQAALLTLRRGPLVRALRAPAFYSATRDRRIALNTARSLASLGLARLYLVTDGLALCLTPRGDLFAAALAAVAHKIIPLASRA